MRKKTYMDFVENRLWEYGLAVFVGLAGGIISLGRLHQPKFGRSIVSTYSLSFGGLAGFGRQLRKGTITVDYCHSNNIYLRDGLTLIGESLKKLRGSFTRTSTAQGCGTSSGFRTRLALAG